SIDWDKQTDEDNTEPRSLENFGMIAGIKIELDADSKGEVVSADNAIPAGVSIFAGFVAAAVAKWNNSGRNLYKLLDSSMSVRTKRGVGLDKYIGEDCDLHEQRLVKINAEGKGILGRKPTGKPVNLNRPKPIFAGQQTLVYASPPNPVSDEQQNTVTAGQQNPVSAGHQNPVSADQPNPVSAGQPNLVSTGDGILGLPPLNIEPKSTYFHSFTYNNQQIIFLITHNSLYSLYMTGRLNGKTAVKPSV
nr:hypothetical protein [Tanacetum cinerariifolium]